MHASILGPQVIKQICESRRNAANPTDCSWNYNLMSHGCASSPFKTPSTLNHQKHSIQDLDSSIFQGHLNHERERVRHLKQRLTDLEAAYHATLDSLDRLQGPRREVAPHEWKMYYKKPLDVSSLAWQTALCDQQAAECYFHFTWEGCDPKEQLYWVLLCACLGHWLLSFRDSCIHVILVD